MRRKYVLLSTTQVAGLFGRCERTIARYVDLGLLGAFVTHGGHRKIPWTQAMAVIRALKGKQKVTRTLLKRLRKERQNAARRR